MSAFNRVDWEILLRDFKHVLEYRGYIRDQRVDQWFDVLIFQIPLYASLIVDPEIRKLLKPDIDKLVEALNLLVPERMSVADGGEIWGGDVFKEIQDETYNYDVVGANTGSSGGGVGGGGGSAPPVVFSNADDIQEFYDQIFHPVAAAESFWFEVDSDEEEYEYIEPKFPVANTEWFSLYVFVISGEIQETRIEKGVITDNAIVGATDEISFPSQTYILPPNSNFTRYQVIGYGPNSLGSYDENYLRKRFISGLNPSNPDYSEDHQESMFQNYSMTREFSLGYNPSPQWWKNGDTGPFFAFGTRFFDYISDDESAPTTPDISPLIRDSIRKAIDENGGQPDDYDWSTDYRIAYESTAVFEGPISQQVTFDGSEKGSNALYSGAVSYLGGNGDGTHFYIVYDDADVRYTLANLPDLEALDDAEILYIYRFIGFPALPDAPDQTGQFSGSGFPAGPILVSPLDQSATITTGTTVTVRPS